MKRPDFQFLVSLTQTCLEINSHPNWRWVEITVLGTRNMSTPRTWRHFSDRSNIAREPKKGRGWARIKEGPAFSSLTSLLLIKTLYIHIQVFPLKHHNHFQDITVTFLVWCNYTVTKPGFIYGLWNEVHMGHMPSVVYYLVIAEL